MSIGVVAITVNGLEIAKQLKKSFVDADIYTLEKFADSETMPIIGSLSLFSEHLLKRYKSLIYIMATGIVVRCIAPYLNNKINDAAVVVVDDKGKFAISLLSGHLGGANHMATVVAKAIRALPVITTASDGQGVMAVDMIAKTHGLIIESMHDAKVLTAMAVNGKNIAWRNSSSLDLPNYFLSSELDCDGVVVVSNRYVTCDKPFAQLIPKNITIGVGCRRGIPTNQIVEFVSNQLSLLDIHPLSIEQIASVDIKFDEVGLIEAASHFNVPIVFVQRSEIEPIEDQFATSDFVKSKIGVASVCEPVAFIAGGKRGHFLSNKQFENGVTVAIFERIENDYN